jgi:hypothetical protein
VQDAALRHDPDCLTATVDLQHTRVLQHVGSTACHQPVQGLNGLAGRDDPTGPVVKDLRIVREAESGKPAPGHRRSKAFHVGTGGPNGRRVAAERGVIGTEEEDTATVDQRRAGVPLQSRPLLGVDVPHQRRIRRRRVRTAGDPDASVGAAVGVADSEALHDGERPAAQTQEMPCGGQADHSTADDDDSIRLLAHVVGPFASLRVAAPHRTGPADYATRVAHSRRLEA